MTNASSSSTPATDGLHDIKGPVEFPHVGMWIAIALGAFVLLAIVVGLIWCFLLRKKEAPAAPPVPPHVRARQKLDEALGLIAQPKPFCTLVSDTVRFYLEERFTFRAPERTTEEFLYELQATNLLLPDQKESLGEFLKRCDLVKFAQYEPREAELKDLHGSAVRLVEETEPAPVAAEAPNASSNPQPAAT